MNIQMPWGALFGRRQPKIQNGSPFPFIWGFPQPPGGDKDRPREAPQNRTNKGKMKNTLYLLQHHFARRVDRSGQPKKSMRQERQSKNETIL
jgi:hypothetical protein